MRAETDRLQLKKRYRNWHLFLFSQLLLIIDPNSTNHAISVDPSGSVHRAESTIAHLSAAVLSVVAVTVGISGPAVRVAIAAPTPVRPLSAPESGRSRNRSAAVPGTRPIAALSVCRECSSRYKNHHRKKQNCTESKSIHVQISP